MSDMPVMYLLDEEKRVVKKEVSLHHLLLEFQEWLYGKRSIEVYRKKGTI